jgi:hypothetical protein
MTDQRREAVARAICRVSCHYDICDCTCWQDESLTIASAGLGALEAGESVIEFGKGTVVIDTGTYGGKPAVFVAPSEKPGPVGERAPTGDVTRLETGERVWLFPTMEQAQSVADALCAVLPRETGESELREFADWVETWVSNPVGAYSTMALDGLFGVARNKLAALPRETVIFGAKLPADLEGELSTETTFRMTLPRETAAAWVADPKVKENLRSFHEVTRAVKTAALSLPPQDAEGWRPIETAPKDGTIFLAYETDGDGVTHWRPLPATERTGGGE